MIFDNTDRLIAAGFDGAYLGIIDAHQYFIELGEPGQGASDEGDESSA